MSLELSIDEKIYKAFHLAVKLCEPLNEGTLVIADSEDKDMVWVHADGLRAKYLEDMKYGRCSIQASIDFDVEAEEKRLDADILLLEKFVGKL